MRVVVTQTVAIPEWLYPGTWPDLSTPATNALSTELSREDFATLWHAIDQSDHRDAFVAQSFDDIGIPHDAPTDVDKFHPGLVAALAAVPTGERWRVAQRWTTQEGQRPNAKRLAALKKIVNTLCEFAERAIASNLVVVLLPDPS